MSDDDRSLFDKVKDAFGMGGDEHDHGHDHAGHDHAGHDHAAHDHTVTDDHRIDDDSIGVDGATQGAGASGAGGGMGATAGLGGAGAGGPAGATPDPSKNWTAPADGTNVRTEYEMGHEFDPVAETIAESGVLAEREGEAVVDTWGTGDKREDRPTD
jgi:hypothetical protein